MVAPVVDYDFDLQQLADWQIIKSFKINLYEKKINADIRINCKKYPKSRRCNKNFKLNETNLFRVVVSPF